MAFLDPDLSRELESLKRQSTRRHLRIVETPHQPQMVVDGRPMLMLASNNYLDLAAHQELKAAVIDAIGRYGVGAGSSRLIAGSLEPLHELEGEIAALKGVEAALVFGSGYLANLLDVS